MTANGKRANRAMRAIEEFTDCNFRTDGDAGLLTDMTDLIADLHHLADAHDIPWSNVLEKAETAHAGDSEDGPPATRAEIEQLNAMAYIACDLAPGMTLDEYRRAMANQRRRERAKVRSDRRRSLRRYLGRVRVPIRTEAPHA